jgi:hypothetical protein
MGDASAKSGFVIEIATASPSRVPHFNPEHVCLTFFSGNDRNMGTALSVIRNTLDNSEEDYKKANDALNSLETLAHLKANNFYTKIEAQSATDTLLVPIDRILLKRVYIKAGVSNTPEHIKEAITSTLDAFIHGQIVDGEL